MRRDPYDYNPYNTRTVTVNGIKKILQAPKDEFFSTRQEAQMFANRFLLYDIVKFKNGYKVFR